MRRKLFTLMTLLLGVVTGAWAEQSDLITDVTLPDIPPATLDLDSQVDFIPDANGWIVFGPSSQQDNVVGKDYWNGSTYSISAAWSVPSGATAPFKGSEERTRVLTVQQTRQTQAFRFTGAEQVSFLVSSGGNRTIYVSLYAYDGETQTEVSGSPLEAGNEDTELLYSGLSASAEYIAYIYESRNINGRIYEVALKGSKGVTSQGIAGVKVDGTDLAENEATNGYTLEGTTITLSEDVKFVSAPYDNIILTYRVTFDDASTRDIDVFVNFDGSEEDGYFIGFATIGETTYTVRALKNTDPTLVADPAAISVVSEKAGTGMATIYLTCVNLQGEGSVTFDSAVEGLSVSPTTFTVDEWGNCLDEYSNYFYGFNVEYQSDEDVAEAVVNLTFTVGSTSVVVPVTYSSTGIVTSLTAVSTASTWDWNDITPQSNITYNPIKPELILVNEGALDFTNFGDASALKFLNIQRPMYRGANGRWCAQAHGFEIKTDVSGVLTVEFGGTNSNERQLWVDGEFKGSISASNATNTAEAYIGAGTHTVMGYDVNTGEYNNLRYYVIKFEPVADFADGDVVSVSSAGYATVVLPCNAFFEGTPDIKAYAAKANGTKVMLNEVTAAPAYTPLVIKAAEGNYALKTHSCTPDITVENDLRGGPVTGDGVNYYVLGKEGTKVGFGLLENGVDLPDTKAYIPAEFFGTSAPGFITIEGADDDIDITTVISAIDNGQLTMDNAEVYNLNGQRVSQPTKGLYIVNGKKVIVK